jgi:hypothetical protein
MKRSTRSIKNVAELDKEIYRLQLQAKNLEDKMDDKLKYLQQNYPGMIVNSVFPNKENITHRLAGSLLNNQKVQTVLEKLTDHLADKAAEGLDNLVDKLFHKKD